MSWNTILGVRLLLFCQAWNDIAMVLSGFITSLFRQNQLDNCCITSFIISFYIFASLQCGLHYTARQLKLEGYKKE
jgi:hypothetical protein